MKSNDIPTSQVLRWIIAWGLNMQQKFKKATLKIEDDKIRYLSQKMAVKLLY